MDALIPGIKDVLVGSRGAAITESLLRAKQLLMAYMVEADVNSYGTLEM